MILTTTPTLEGQPIKQYLGIVTGETIIGANAIKDFMAGLTDFFILKDIPMLGFGMISMNKPK